MKFFVYTVIAIVAAAVIAGFFIVGSPQQERLRQLDGQRVSNLQYLQSEIVSYWQSKGKLPAKLSDLNDPLRGVTVPQDPQTGMEYQYTPTGLLSFSLCADFAAADASVSPVPMGAPVAPRSVYYGGIDQNWGHGPGPVCFERTIDKDFFKPVLQK